MITAMRHGLALCHTCSSAQPVSRGHCALCGAALHVRKPNSIQSTLALLLGASALYIPANMLPIMITEQFGRATESTIIGGVFLLWSMGSYPVAAVIFVASVLVPVGKLAALFVLCWSVGSKSLENGRRHASLYRLTELVGKWSMVDVFVLAVLTALVRIAGVIVIRPGSAALAFSGVVILTMLAARSFDPRLIWDRLTDEPRGSR